MANSVTDLMLDDDGDIAFDGQDITVSSSGKEVVAQRLYIVLSTFQGEWFLDILFGTPYFQNILGNDFDTVILNAIFLNVILSTPGVNRLASEIEYDFDAKERRARIKFIAISDNEELIPIDFPLNIF